MCKTNNIDTNFLVIIIINVQMCYVNCYALRIIRQYVNDIIDDLLNNNVMWKIASTMCNHAS